MKNGHSRSRRYVLSAGVVLAALTYMSASGAFAQSAPAAEVLRSSADESVAIEQNSVLFRRLGLSMRRDDVLLGGTPEKYIDLQISMEQLKRLLILKSQPEMLDDPKYTKFFAAVLPTQKRELYGKDRIEAFENSGPISFEFSGRDEFDREEMRQRFLVNERATLMGMIPHFPFTIAEMRRAQLVSYDLQRQRFDIKVAKQSPWPFDPRVDFQLSESLKLPSFWPVAESKAKQIVGLLSRANSSGRANDLTLLARYQVEGVHYGITGAVLEISTLDMTMFDSHLLMQELGKVELPDLIVKNF